MPASISLWPRAASRSSATAFDIDVLSLTAFDFGGRHRPVTDPFGRSLGYLNGSGGFVARPRARRRRAADRQRCACPASYTYTRARDRRRDSPCPDFFIVPGVFGAHRDARRDAALDRRGSTRRSTSSTAATPTARSSPRGRTRAYRYPGFDEGRRWSGSVRLIAAGGDALCAPTSRSTTCSTPRRSRPAGAPWAAPGSPASARRSDVGRLHARPRAAL